MKILIIHGHPNPENTFCRSILKAYKHGALSSGHEVEVIDIGQIEFDINLKFGYLKRVELEPCLLDAQEKIIWAKHIVIIHPVWWGGMPAKLKGFFDRVFLPGFAFEKREDSVWWDKLLINKSARIITTLDQPGWYYRLRYGRPGHRALKSMTLNFSGIEPVSSTVIGPLRGSSEKYRKNILARIESIGCSAK